MSTTYGAVGGTYGAVGDTYGGGTVALEPRWLVTVLGADGQWLDVSCDARSVSIDQSRSSYVEAFSAATATVEFANADDRYSTWAADNIWRRTTGYVTGVPIRVGTVLAGDVEWLFTGTTDTVGEAWPQFQDAVAVVSATDAFKNLARVEQPARAAVGGGELTGARVNRILADVGFTGPTRIDAGTVAVAATTLAGLAIDQLRVIGETEWGWLYTAGDGALVFRGRTAVDTDPRMTDVQWVFTDTHTIVTPDTPAALAATPPVLVEPFDNFTDAPWAVTNTPTIVAGRTGTALQAGSSVPRVDYTIPAAAQSDTITMGFAWRRTDATTLKRHLFGLWSDGGTREHNRLTYTPSADLLEFDRLTTTIASATPVTFTTNTWYYIEIQVKQADAPNGFVIVRIDGATVINATGLDTRNVGTTGVYDTVRLWTSAASCTGQWDDLYITTGSDQPFYGDITIPPGPPSPVPVVTVAACYADATTLQADDGRIINRATVTPPSLAAQIATDTPSVDQFGIRSWERTDLPFTTGPDALGLAQAVVNAYKSDDQRIDRIVVEAAGRLDAYPAAHGARIGDRVRFVRVLPGGGQVDAELLVMARTDRMRPAGTDNRLGEWQMTLTTAGADYIAGTCRWDLGTWDECAWGV